MEVRPAPESCSNYDIFGNFGEWRQTQQRVLSDA